MQAADIRAANHFRSEQGCDVLGFALRLFLTHAFPWLSATREFVL